MYDVIQVASPTSTASPATTDTRKGVEELSFGHLKDSILSQFQDSSPSDILTAYLEGIEPWFPVLSVTKLRVQLSGTWEDTTLEVVLLSLAIVLVVKSAGTAGSEDDRSSRSLYFFAKSRLAATEVLGINSFGIIQARILINLFEILHGFYPAAYISIAASTRAMEALDAFPEMGATEDTTVITPLDTETNILERVLTWCGILILDR